MLLREVPPPKPQRGGGVLYSGFLKPVIVRRSKLECEPCHASETDFGRDSCIRIPALQAPSSKKRQEFAILTKP
jgi:hypothetical protein